MNHQVHEPTHRNGRVRWWIIHCWPSWKVRKFRRKSWCRKVLFYTHISKWSGIWKSATKWIHPSQDVTWLCSLFVVKRIVFILGVVVSPTPTWYPGDASVLTVLPCVFPDTQVSPSQKCKDSTCFGHYSHLPTNVTEVDAAPAPSVLINKEFNKDSRWTPLRTKLLANKALLDPSHVTFQWKHLEQVKLNHARGVGKARKNKSP